MKLSLAVALFFNDAATTEIYALSLHDALPIFARSSRAMTEGIRALETGNSDMKLSLAVAAGVLAGVSTFSAAAVAADAPPGALSCSGCHSPNATETSTPPRLIGRDPAKTVAAH